MDDMKFSVVVVAIFLLVFFSMAFDGCTKSEERLHEQRMFQLKNDCKGAK